MHEVIGTVRLLPGPRRLNETTALLALLTRDAFGATRL